MMSSDSGLGGSSRLTSYNPTVLLTDASETEVDLLFDEDVSNTVANAPAQQQTPDLNDSLEDNDLSDPSLLYLAEGGESKRSFGGSSSSIHNRSSGSFRRNRNNEFIRAKIKRTNTTGQGRVFLSPPERLMVDQSVNLMDVESAGDIQNRNQTNRSAVSRIGELTRKPIPRTSSGAKRLFTAVFGGNREGIATSQQRSSSSSSRHHVRSRSNSGSSSSILPSIHTAPPQSPARSTSPPFCETLPYEPKRQAPYASRLLVSPGSSDGEDTPTRDVAYSRYDSSSDAEEGIVTPTKRKSSTVRKRRLWNKKKPDNNAVAKEPPSIPIVFPPGYDPNEWERRVAEVFSDEPENDADDDRNPERKGNRKKHSKKKRVKMSILKKNSIKKRQKQPKKSSSKQANQQQRYRWDPVALVLCVLFVVAAIVMATLVFTGQFAWKTVHSPNEAMAKKPNPQDVFEDANHQYFAKKQSYLDVASLPASARLIVKNQMQQQQQLRPSNPSLVAAMPTDPVFRAMKWITHDPHVTVVDADQDSSFFGINQTALMHHAISSLEAMNAVQRFALATFYFATEGPDSWKEGNNWENPITHWLSYTSSECDWFSTAHVYDTAENEAFHHVIYDVCNRYQQLHTLALSDNGLHGTLPATELALLSTLRRLDLSKNELKGIFPHTLLGQWKNLEHLNLSQNRFSGMIPTEIAQLTNSNALYTIDLSGNQFTGKLASEVGVLHSLHAFNVSHNKLTGELPTHLGSILNTRGRYPRWESLDLSHNNFVGGIPSELGLLTGLTNLALHNNNLSEQQLPSELCALMTNGSLERLTVDCAWVKCDCECDCSATTVLSSSTRLGAN